MFEAKLIALYFYICEKYDKELKYHCQRYSNNSKPVFTDEEILTIYLYVSIEEGRHTIKDIHRYASKHLRSWFPHLPSYQAYNNRLNRLNEVLRQLSAEVLSCQIPEDCSTQISLIDSMPVITCSGRREGKVATELTCKGRCASKNMFFYGLKLHVVGWSRKGTIPWPEAIIVSNAAENDLTIFKENCGQWGDHSFYGDKIYYNKEWFADFEAQHNSQMYTPVKAVKGKSQRLEQFDKAAEDMYSKLVSSIRQPIESFFNWLNVKTEIQKAYRVRSTKGLLVHIFGKIAVAFLNQVFNP